MKWLGFTKVASIHEVGHHTKVGVRHEVYSFRQGRDFT